MRDTPQSPCRMDVSSSLEITSDATMPSQAETAAAPPEDCDASKRGDLASHARSMFESPPGFGELEVEAPPSPRTPLSRSRRSVSTNFSPRPALSPRCHNSLEAIGGISAERMPRKRRSRRTTDEPSESVTPPAPQTPTSDTPIESEIVEKVELLSDVHP